MPVIFSPFFWTAEALGADYEKTTPMTRLDTPIDFSQTVYAEAETYADVDFWNLKDWKHLDAAGKPYGLSVLRSRCGSRAC